MEWLLHNSFEKIYREPFGAVQCGTKVELRLRVMDRQQVEGVTLWAGRDGRELQPVQMELEQEEDRRSFYRAVLKMPEEPCLFWYYFSAARDGKNWYYGRRCGLCSGRGELKDSVPPAYQVTVYHPESKTPDWFKNTVVYQVFPDRFCNGNPGCRVNAPKKESLLHAHWDNTPLYIKDPETGEVNRWDFFGGNLLGVLKKLPYLEKLGISCLYFNPVFEAASNHKYDTGDYHRIDPMLGDEELFRRLCEEADAKGIAVILDGVFSHTGSDSIYFNRENSYDSLGAYQSKDSPYYSWYRFRHHPDDYESWWNIPVLPNVNENDPGYLDFIISGEKSVLKHWIGAGAKGWRLDVADELPDNFIRLFRSTLKEQDRENVLIGEVWEDASNKISYGKRRPYLLGGMLDSVMNYPFRNLVIDYLNGQRSPRDVHLHLVTLREHYPGEYFYSALNVLGSHDTVRLLSALEDDWRRVKMAALLQMTFPGAPCIYYGDEAGLTGGKDPMNRKTFPWGRENEHILKGYREAVALRNYYPVFRTGRWRSFYIGSSIYGYIRSTDGEKDVFGGSMPGNLACVLFNSDTENSAGGEVDISGVADDEKMLNVFDNYSETAVVDGKFSFELGPSEGRVFITRRWSRREVDRRNAGILLHPTSFPSPYGMGDLGREAYRFIDFMESCGQRLWQVLPLNPPGYGNSPYMSDSAFAGNYLLIDPEQLKEEGLLSAGDLESSMEKSGGTKEHIDFQHSMEIKKSLLEKAYANFAEKKEEFPQLARDFSEFCEKQEGWLEDYTLFAALNKYYDGKAWPEWEEGISRRNPKILKYWRDNLAKDINLYSFWQFLFYRQWKKLKNYANSRGIRLIGDLPIYVAHDSADVWANPSLFRLDSQGNPTHVAGVPPDYFSADGQRWGNPLYDWEANREEDYGWWAARIMKLRETVDIIRIDHFRAFADYWEIPVGARTAKEGQWKTGPGYSFFQRLEEKIGEVAFLAENLGYLSPEAEALKDETGFPGMKILQFMLEDFPDRSWKVFLDEKDEFLYTGTHDNETLVQWIGKHKELETEELEETAWNYIRAVHRSDADCVIIPLQDYLSRGEEARMNAPGTVENNWKWRYRDEDLDEVLAENIRELMESYSRKGKDPLEYVGSLKSRQFRKMKNSE